MAAQSARRAHDADRGPPCELIGACPLFRGVDETACPPIAAAAIEVEFPADRVIAREGEIGTGFFIVVEGRVRVVRDGRPSRSLGRASSSASSPVLDGGAARRR